MRNNHRLYDSIERLLIAEVERSKERFQSSYGPQREAALADFQRSLERFNSFILDTVVPDDLDWPGEIQSHVLNGAEEPSKAVVMVVDDEPSVLLFVSYALTSHGYSVVPAVDGAEALEIARAHKGRIDVVLTDVRMPKMDGTELVKHLQEEELIPRVLMMTGWSSPNVPSHVRVQSLRKPFGSQILLERLENLLTA